LIRSLSKTEFDAIVTAAQVFVNLTRAPTASGTEVIDVDVDNERACLVDNSDSDLDHNVSNFCQGFTNHADLIFQDSMYYEASYGLPSSWTLHCLSTFNMFSSSCALFYFLGFVFLFFLSLHH
jgi:hypothetical protein